MYELIPPLVAALRMCDRCTSSTGGFAVASDTDVGRQILDIFMKHRVHVSGMLRRNNFMEVRDADFQRGLNQAIENNWLKLKQHDRYTYILTEAGFAAGLSAQAETKPVAV
jgi:hypothetical protein